MSGIESQPPLELGLWVLVQVPHSLGASVSSSVKRG